MEHSDGVSLSYDKTVKLAIEIMPVGYFGYNRRIITWHNTKLIYIYIPFRQQINWGIIYQR